MENLYTRQQQAYKVKYTWMITFLIVSKSSLISTRLLFTLLLLLGMLLLVVMVLLLMLLMVVVVLRLGRMRRLRVLVNRMSYRRNGGCMQNIRTWFTNEISRTRHNFYRLYGNRNVHYTQNADAWENGGCQYEYISLLWYLKIQRYMFDESGNKMIENGNGQQPGTRVWEWWAIFQNVISPFL